MTHPTPSQEPTRDGRSGASEEQPTKQDIANVTFSDSRTRAMSEDLDSNAGDSKDDHAESESSLRNTLACVACGSLLSPGQFCSSCGTPTTTTSALAPQTKGRIRHRSWTPRLIGMVAGLAVVAVGTGAFLASRGPTAVDSHGPSAVDAPVSALNSITGKLHINDFGMNENGCNDWSTDASWTADRVNALGGNSAKTYPCAKGPGGGFQDLRDGTAVVLRDGTGKILATSTLSHGTLSGAGITFSYKLDGVPNSDFYELEISHRGAIAYAIRDFESTGWIVNSSIG